MGLMIQSVVVWLSVLKLIATVTIGRLWCE